MYTELKATRSFTNTRHRDAQADPHRHVVFAAQSDERGLLTVYFIYFFYLRRKHRYTRRSRDPNSLVKMFCMLLEQTSRALNLEPPCHYCHPGCLSCKHKLNALPPPPITGYHPECHTPTIEPEADSDSWICRQCVFAVSTKVRLLISPSHTPGWGGRVGTFGV